MEALAGGEVNGESNKEEDLVDKSSLCSNAPSREETAGSVVYQLVRVDGDGTLIPATDDEVMEVEHMLEDDKKDLPAAEGLGQSEEYISDVVLSSKKSNINILEGSSVSENSEANSGPNIRLEEEKLQLPTEAPIRSPKYNNVDKGSFDQQVYPTACNNIPHTGSSSQEASYLIPMALNEGSVGPCTDSIEKDQSASRSLIAGILSGTYPDFSLLEGEICLDDLTIRELQETFRATFGRQTSVKDKLWLKRRIAMQLTNSCDVPSTGFVIKDRKIVMKTAKKRLCTSEITKYVVTSQPPYQHIGSVKDKTQDLSSSSVSHFQEERSFSGKRLRTSTLENGLKSENQYMKVIGAKRIRKPTRRYIEELAEIETRECCVPPITPFKGSGQVQSSAKYRFRPTSSVCSQHTTFITRKDFLGGCGVQIPYVSRVRRGRPRTNIVSLMNAILIPKEKPVAETSYREDQDPVFGRLGASGDYSDDYTDIVLRPKCSIRRKHHRAWTLCEVVKLVEGVSKYGAGRWSEIKRLAFPSYTYRTSVDLKDKWRNLLRACFTHRPTEKRDPQRNAPVPIPMPILLRVRELAEMHVQEGIGFGSGKLTGHNRGDPKEKRSGFL